MRGRHKRITDRVHRPCIGCGKSTLATSQRCTPCQRAAVMTADEYRQHLADKREMRAAELKDRTATRADLRIMNLGPAGRAIDAVETAEQLPSGCRIPTFSIDTSGYGRRWVMREPDQKQSSRRERMHRVVYEVLVGPIEAGQTVHHKCGTRACVNPDHLQSVSNEENVAESWRAKESEQRMLAAEARIAELEAQVRELGGTP